MHAEKSPSTPPVGAIEAAAAAWLSLRDRGLSSEETAAFMHWLQQDPRHAEIFGELDRIWQDFNRLSAVPVSPASPPDADLLTPRSRPPRPARVRAALAGLGVAAAISIAFVGLERADDSSRVVATEIGGVENLALPDGSTVRLNTRSTVETNYTDAGREVRLAAGEGFFVVKPDPARPFVVRAGPVVVQAVGTAFNVRQREDAVEVLVTEGSVRVLDAREGRSLLKSGAAAPGGEPRLLGSGERVVLALGGSETAAAIEPAPVEKLSAAEVQRARAWQEQRLEFDRASLWEIAREFNRYSRRQIAIADPELAARRLSGTFRTDGSEAFVRLLENDFRVVAYRGDHVIVLHARK